MPAVANAGSCRCYEQAIANNAIGGKETCELNKQSQKDCDLVAIEQTTQSWMGYDKTPECIYFPSENCLEDLQCQCHVVDRLSSATGPVLSDTTYVIGYREVAKSVTQAINKSESAFGTGYYDRIIVGLGQWWFDTPENLCSGPVEDAIEKLGPNKNGVGEYKDSVDTIDCSLFTPNFTDIKPRDIVPPSPKIIIPGLEFSKTINYDAEGLAYIPWLAEYILAIYNFGIAMASVIAVVLIVIQGIRIVISAGGEQKKAAYQTITRVIIGLVIAWSSYAILYTINPDLVKLKYLKIRNVTTADLELTEDEEEVNGTNPDGFPISISGINLSGAAYVMPNVLDQLKKAAEQLKSEGIELYVADGFRSPAEQIAKIQKNCVDPSAAKCTPKDKRPMTCIMTLDTPNKCPHTTGRAVDVWGRIGGAQCIMQAACTKDPATDPCRNNPCQAKVIDIMRKNGFCNIPKEAWHFELKGPDGQGMSSNCT